MTAGMLRTIDDVDAAWLTAALSGRYPGLEVTSVTADPFMGYKPNKSRLHLTYNAVGRDAGLPPTMIVKASFPGLGTSAAGLDFATTAEALTYRDLVPRLGATTPECFYIGIADGKAAMLMEDLDRKGATYLNAFTKVEYGLACAYIDAFAAIHAKLWGSPLLDKGGVFGPETEIGGSRVEHHGAMKDFISAKPSFEKVMRSHRDLPRAAVVPRRLAEQPRMEAAIWRLLDSLKTMPLTIVHGDEHLGNCYVLPDGTPGLLDWFGRPEPWSIGYAWFLVTSLDGLDRRAWERPLLARYLQRLTEHGVAAPSFEEAWFTYRCSVVWPLAGWFVNPGEWQPERINTVNVARASLAAIDHDSYGLLGV